MSSSSEEYFAGIDEAGRGPVLGIVNKQLFFSFIFLCISYILGPMVYACAFAPISRKEEFGKMGFHGFPIIY